MPGSPLFKAMSRSRHSSWRTSPTMMRSGRIRSASLTRRRSRTSPVPSRLGCRVCIATTSGSGTLELEDLLAGDDPLAGGNRAARQLSRVVLPGLGAAGDDDVEAGEPPRPRGSRPPSGSSCRAPTSSSSAAARDARTCGCSRPSGRRVMSGMTTCRRLPSGSIASTNGVDRSTRRPEVFSIRSTRSRTSPSVEDRSWSARCDPLRATKTRPGSLIQISSIVGSSSNRCSGPKPATAVVDPAGRRTRDRRAAAARRTGCAPRSRR